MVQEIHKYSFTERIGFSRGVSHTGNIKELLLVIIPSAFSVREPIKQDDINGTDHWVDRRNLPSLSIDLKASDIDPILYHPPEDDLALETYSNLDRKTIGWTRNKNKRTDYILWYFKPTKRWVLVPFPMLCHAFIIKWQNWKRLYKTAIQTTNEDGKSWQSECVFVPRLIIWREIYNIYGGILKS